MHVVSNPYIPFISMDEYNETLIDIYDGMSRSFYARHRNGKDSLEIYRIYDESNRQLVFTLIDHSQSKYVKHDTIKNMPLYVDGPSLFFIFRALIQSGMEYSIPTIVDKKIENTYLNFEKCIDIIDSDLFSAPVRTRQFNGICEWEGGTSAGLVMIQSPYLSSLK
jgi:hypothetical protein